MARRGPRPSREEEPRRYTVALAPRAVKELAAIDAVQRRRIARRIDALQENPRPPGAIRLAGHDDLWRLRVGDYRIIYAIDGGALVILVIRVGHQREIYRKLD